jgi:PAS domain S-box-containing protein
MMHKSISLIAAVLLTIVFCTFIMVYEKRALATAQSRIGTHARIIEDAMWNYNRQGGHEYLKLAAFTDRYESLKVTHHNGDPFQEIHQEPAAGLDSLLIAIHLMPRVPLKADVLHLGNIIGRMEAVWIPKTIYMHAYVFFALVMVYMTMQLYLRLLRSKTRLEERVKDRTAELMASNLELKQEIVERVRAEEALRTSEQKHRLLSENIMDVIWAIDMQLNYTYISPAAIHVYGWDAPYIATLTMEKALTPDSFQKVSRLLAEEITFGERTEDYSRSVTTDLEVVCKDQSIVISELTASFVVDEAGQPTGILGVARDITERRNADIEKAALQRQLERSKKMESLGLLAGGVAHDLNNVLSGIVSYPDLLLMDLPEDHAMRAPIETIKESGQKGGHHRSGSVDPGPPRCQYQRNPESQQPHRGAAATICRA